MKSLRIMIGQVESGVHPWTNQYGLQGKTDKPQSGPGPVVGGAAKLSQLCGIYSPHSKKNVAARSE